MRSRLSGFLVLVMRVRFRCSGTGDPVPNIHQAADDNGDDNADNSDNDDDDDGDNHAK